MKTLKVYVSNHRTPYYIKQKLTKLKGEINKPTIIVGNFNTPLSKIDRPKISKGIKQVNTINQMDLIDIFRIFIPKHHNTHFSQVNIEQSPT